VANELFQGVDKISDDWSEFPNDLVGRRFIARRIQSANLEGENLFQLLAASGEKAKLGMSHETIVVVGFTFSGSDGFIALAEFADPTLPGSGQGEDLLDHECAVAKGN
jgi:CDP-diacylglycerol pyrophosphatase